MSDQTLGTVYFEEAIERVRLRIRADSQGRRPDVALMLKTIAARFADPAFGVDELKRLTAPPLATLRAFEGELKRTPGVYLKHCRLELADLVLAATTEAELTVAEVAAAIGYTTGRSFARAFHEWAGRVPSQRRRPADSPEVVPAPLPEGERASPFRRALTGGLDIAAGREAVGRWRLQLCAGARPLPEEGRVYLSYRGDPHARLVAESLWTVARDLPPRQRRALLCDAVRFRSPALFELLGEESREAAARGDAGEAVARAELALAVVEEHGAGFGDELHDLRALAWARQGDARLQAGDLTGAEQACRFAKEALQVSPLQTMQTAPSPYREAAQLEVRWLESSLRLAQHRFDDACELVEETIARLRALDADPQLLARALTRRALEAKRRGDEPEAAVALLREAEAVLGEGAPPALLLVTRLHLAQAALDAGQGAEAERLLPRARALGRLVGEGVVEVRLIHVEALVHWQQGRYAEAEKQMLQAREAFLDRGEIASAAVVSIDLAKLHDRLRNAARVSAVIAETVPLVESLAVHPKAMAALRQLRCAEAAGGEPPPDLLERLRTTLAALLDAP